MEDGAEELEDLVHFSVSELPSRGYGVMEEIRRQGKLCDVTLKVPRSGRWLLRGKRLSGKRVVDRERVVQPTVGGERLEGNRPVPSAEGE